MGFSITNIQCVTEIDGCNDVPESIYFQLDSDFPGIPQLATNGAIYRATMATKATVPLPASAWFMLSGLMLLAGRAYRRDA